MQMPDLKSDISGYHLVDFDWRVKVMFGSSTTVAVVPPPVVATAIHMSTQSVLDPKCGNITNTLLLEMNNQELKTFINALEKTNTQ